MLLNHSRSVLGLGGPPFPLAALAGMLLSELLCWHGRVDYNL
jgi:hypothetical protein